jgi:hypothetical protein
MEVDEAVTPKWSRADLCFLDTVLLLYNGPKCDRHFNTLLLRHAPRSTVTAQTHPVVYYKQLKLDESSRHD